MDFFSEKIHFPSCVFSELPSNKSTMVYAMLQREAKKMYTQQVKLSSDSQIRPPVIVQLVGIISLRE